MVRIYWVTYLMTVKDILRLEFFVEHIISLLWIIEGENLLYYISND